MGRYIPVCVSLALVLFSLTSVKSLAVIHNPNHEGKVEHEYIVVIKNVNNVKDYLLNQGFDWKTFQDRLKQNYGIDISVKLDFGDFKAISIKTNRSLEPLLEDRDIDFIEPNIRFSLDLTEYSSTPVSGIESELKVCKTQNTGNDIWGLSRMDQREKLKKLGLFDSADYTWSSTDDGTGVDVYVMDTGVYVDHEDIKGRARHGFTSSAIASREDNMDYKGHGTHVSGTIAGTTYGVAKNAQIIAVKVLDGTGAGTTVDLVEGLQYIYQQYSETKNSGKVVVNLSLGAPGSAPTMERAVMECIKRGIHLVVAAGNEYDDACMYTPGRVEEVITVGSTSKSDELSYFSNYGPCVDVLAPGSDILSTWIDSPTSTAKASGTSMACPHVAGAVARYLSQPWEKYGDLPTPQEVREHILQSATNNAINLNIGSRKAEASSTPNKLLYMPCSSASTYSSASKTAASILTALVMCICTFSVTNFTW